MEDRLRINTPLWGGIEGIIGRRDYFLNCVYIWIISTLLVFPYSIWLINNLQSYWDLFNPYTLFQQAPVFFKFFMVASILASGILMVSNIFRRMNDINGQENIAANIIVSFLMLLPSFAIFIPSFPVVIFGLFSFILGFVLLLKKGKITSQLPYDFTKEFNWGAFFGTWIWGLFNKTYIPLWYLLLCFTPVGFYFQLVCGIKGNEWAYKNKGWSDVNAFNKNQEKQTAIFAIVMALVIPIIYLAVIIGLIIAFGASSVSSNSSQTESKVEKVFNYFSDLAMSSFDSYEITEEENRFFTNGEEWKYLSFSDKKDLLDFAAVKSSMEKQKSAPQNEYRHYSKYTELPKTKIYDTKTHILLAEFEEPQVGEKPSFKEIVKSALNSYKFYNPE